MQAASDIFLGWTEGVDGRHYYWRQLRDMKGSADIEAMEPTGMSAYARACGWTLARAHARTGDPIAIAAYLGKSGKFAAPSPTSPGATPTKTTRTTSKSPRPSLPVHSKHSTVSERPDRRLAVTIVICVLVVDASPMTVRSTQWYPVSTRLGGTDCPARRAAASPEYGLGDAVADPQPLHPACGEPDAVTTGGGHR
jgi:hypothetical protein